MVQLLGKFLPGAMGFVVAACLTRFLTPDEYGVYSLAMALSQLVALGGFGWLGLSVARMTTGRPGDSRFVSSVLAVFAIVALAAASSGAALCLLPAGASHASVILAAVLGSIVFAYLDLKSSFYAAAFDFAAFLVLNLARAAASAAVGLAVAYYGGGGLEVFVASSIAMLAVCLLSRGSRSVRPALAVDVEAIKRLCAFGLPIAGSLTLFAMSGWTDRLILGAYHGKAAVGLYAAAMMIVQNTLQMAAQAIGAAAYPLAVLAYERGGRSASDRQLAQNIIALLGIMLPGGVGLCMLAPNIALVLVGKDYRAAVIALTPLLAAASVISGIRGSFVDHAFQLTGKTWSYLGIAAVMAAVNLAALMLLVPRYGYMGAGAASLVTAIAGLTQALIASRRVYRLPLPLRDVAKVLAAVLAMALVLRVLAPFSGPAALGVQIGAGAMVYAASAFALNLFSFRQAAMTTLLRWLAAR